MGLRPLSNRDAIQSWMGHWPTLTPTLESERRSRVVGQGIDPKSCDYGLACWYWDLAVSLDTEKNDWSVLQWHGLFTRGEKVRGTYLDGNFFQDRHAGVCRSWEREKILKSTVPEAERLMLTLAFWVYVIRFLLQANYGHKRPALHCFKSIPRADSQLAVMQCGSARVRVKDKRTFVRAVPTRLYHGV